MRKTLSVLGIIFGIAILAQVAGVSLAAPYPTGLGGTGTSVTPASGTIPIGNGAGSYTPALLTPGTNVIISNASGSVTIAVPGTAFLPSSTVYVATVNGQGGAVTITSSTLGVATNTISLFNGNGFTTTTIQAVLNALSATGLASYSSSTGVFSVSSSSLALGSAAQHSFSDFLPSSTVYVASVNGQSGAVTVAVPATTTINGTQASVFKLIGDGVTATSSVNGSTTTFSIINTGNWAGTWQGVNSSTFYLATNPNGYISFAPATTTINGTKAASFQIIGTGGITSTVSGATTTFSLATTSISQFNNDKGYITAASTTTINGATSSNQTVVGATGISISTTAGTINSTTTVTNIGVTSFNGNGCVTAANTTGTVTLSVTCISGNQSITFSLSGDATGTASGATAITDSVTVTGLNGKVLPANTTGTLQFSGSAWKINLATSSLGTYDANGNLSSYIGSTCSGGQFVTGFSATGTVACGTPSGGGSSATSSVALFTVTGTGTSTISGNATTISVIPYLNTIQSVPQQYWITGCAGLPAPNFQTCVYNIYLSMAAQGGGTIQENFDIPTSTVFGWTGLLSFNVNGDQVQMQCAANVVLPYVGTSTAWAQGATYLPNENIALNFDFGNPIGHAKTSNNGNCDLRGSPSLIAAGNANTATSTAIYYGGDWTYTNTALTASTTNAGAVGVSVDFNINGFGRNQEMGHNAYVNNFTGTSSGGNGGNITLTADIATSTKVFSNISASILAKLMVDDYLFGSGLNNTTYITQIGTSTVTVNNNPNATASGVTISAQWGSLFQADNASNSGERNDLQGGTYTDPGNSSSADAIFIAPGAAASTFFNFNSADDAQIYCGPSDGLCDVGENHIENAAYNTYGNYIPIINPSSDRSTAINASFEMFANDATPGSGKTWTTLIQHGGQLTAIGDLLDNYNGATVTNFSDHSNDNGVESEMICMLQVQSGGLTNIVAGGGSVTYSLQSGNGCLFDNANSYPLEWSTTNANVIQLTSGNNVVMSVDHTGNATIGLAGTSGSLHVQGNVNASGTISVNGIPVTDGGADFIGPNIFMGPTSTAVLGNLVQGGGVQPLSASTTLTGAQFCSGGLINVFNTTGPTAITLPSMATLASSSQTPCAGSIWSGQFAQQYMVNNSTSTVTSATNGANEVQEYAPGTPSILQPGQEWFITGQFENTSTVNGAGAAGTILVVKYLLEQTSTPLTVNGNTVQYNGVGLSTSTPSSLAGNYLSPSGTTLNVAPTLASSSMSFEFFNATATAPAFLDYQTSGAKNITQVNCFEYAAATTTVELYYNTTLASSGIQQVILSSIACGINGTSVTSFTTSTLPAGAFLFANVNSTAGTPQLTTVNVQATKL
jgi:hypothetical protein